MANLEVNYDTRPYLPDLFIKNNIYSSCDAVNNNNNILLNSTIFIFNIEVESINSPYNDILYLLYGIKNPSVETYVFPPLYFFYNENNNQNYLYKNIVTYNKLNNNIQLLLSLIGYNTNNINESIFQYQEVLIYEAISKKYKNII